MRRVKELETDLQKYKDEHESPRIYAAAGEENKQNKQDKKWRSVMFWPQVMLPYLFFVILSLIYIAIEIVKNAYGRK
jgi:hypothetical protein